MFNCAGPTGWLRLQASGQSNGGLLQHVDNLVAVFFFFLFFFVNVALAGNAKTTHAVMQQLHDANVS